MLALDTIVELSDCVMESCAMNGISYSADMSTEGYYLTKERFIELLDRSIHRIWLLWTERERFTIAEESCTQAVKRMKRSSAI